MTLRSPEVAPPPARFDFDCGTLIIGAGACGLVAALAAHEGGQNTLVIEAGPIPSGSTALSAGLIPAACTMAQSAAGIDDNTALFASDIQTKANGENDQALVNLLTQNAGLVIDWLTAVHELPFSVVTNFDYPGHSRRRMHGLPTRSGTELIDGLRAACERAGIDIICDRRAEVLFQDGPRITGASIKRSDGVTEDVGCNKMILACNGFGGNKVLVQKHIPEIQDGLWFGHDANRGEAIIWGEALGADLRHLTAYQGHGNVAQPHGILITWAVITEGGVQVNRDGERFWNEAQGYSEAAQAVLAQPESEAFAIFDERIADVARQFEDFKRAEAAGAIVKSDTMQGLAKLLGINPKTFQNTMDSIPSTSCDQFGRKFNNAALEAPFCGVRVTGALFHTQGGLKTDEAARVLKSNGQPIPNLFAGGGAACGVSGRSDSGYLSGNGLLSAVVLGYIAGQAKT